MNLLTETDDANRIPAATMMEAEPDDRYPREIIPVDRSFMAKGRRIALYPIFLALESLYHPLLGLRTAYVAYRMQLPGQITIRNFPGTLTGLILWRNLIWVNMHFLALFKSAGYLIEANDDWSHFRVTVGKQNDRARTFDTLYTSGIRAKFVSWVRGTLSVWFPVSIDLNSGYEYAMSQIIRSRDYTNVLMTPLGDEQNRLRELQAGNPNVPLDISSGQEVLHNYLALKQSEFETMYESLRIDIPHRNVKYFRQMFREREEIEVDDFRKATKIIFTNDEDLPIIYWQLPQELTIDKYRH